jgi:hypothetical protein
MIFQSLLLQKVFNPWNATIADWFMAAGGFATVCTLIYLIRSSRGQQKTMDEFKDLFKQLEVQNDIMRQGNQLTSEQLDLMRSAQFKATDNSNVSTELLQLEKDKFRLSNLPRFYSSGEFSGPGQFELTLVNYGNGRARVDEISKIGGRIQFQNLNLPEYIGKGGSFKLYGVPPQGQNPNFVPFAFTLKYSDDIGNTYTSRVTRTTQAAKVEEPILLTSS